MPSPVGNIRGGLNAVHLPAFIRPDLRLRTYLELLTDGRSNQNRVTLAKQSGSPSVNTHVYLPGTYTVKVDGDNWRRNRDEERRFLRRGAARGASLGVFSPIMNTVARKAARGSWKQSILKTDTLELLRKQHWLMLHREAGHTWEQVRDSVLDGTYRAIDQYWSELPEISEIIRSQAYRVKPGLDVKILREIFPLRSTVSDLCEARRRETLRAPPSSSPSPNAELQAVKDAFKSSQKDKCLGLHAITSVGGASEGGTQTWVQTPPEARAGGGAARSASANMGGGRGSPDPLAWQKSIGVVTQVNSTNPFPTVPLQRRQALDKPFSQVKAFRRTQEALLASRENQELVASNESGVPFVRRIVAAAKGGSAKTKGRDPGMLDAVPSAKHFTEALMSAVAVTDAAADAYESAQGGDGADAFDDNPLPELNTGLGHPVADAAAEIGAAQLEAWMGGGGNDTDFSATQVKTTEHDGTSILSRAHVSENISPSIRWITQGGRCIYGTPTPGDLVEYYQEPQCGLKFCNEIPTFINLKFEYNAYEDPDYQSFKIWYILNNFNNNVYMNNVTKQSTTIYLIKVDFSKTDRLINSLLSDLGPIENVTDEYNYPKFFNQKLIDCEKVIDIQNSLKNDELVILFVYDPKINEIFTIYCKNSYHETINKIQISIINRLINNNNTIIASINLVLHNLIFQLFPDILKNLAIILQDKSLEDFVVEGYPLNSYQIDTSTVVFLPQRRPGVSTDIILNEKIFGNILSDEPLCSIPIQESKKPDSCANYEYFFTPLILSSGGARSRECVAADLYNLQFFAAVSDDYKNYDKMYWAIENPPTNKESISYSNNELNTSIAQHLFWINYQIFQKFSDPNPKSKMSPPFQTLNSDDFIRTDNSELLNRINSSLDFGKSLENIDNCPAPDPASLSVNKCTSFQEWLDINYPNKIDTGAPSSCDNSLDSSGDHFRCPTLFDKINSPRGPASVRINSDNIPEFKFPNIKPTTHYSGPYSGINCTSENPMGDPVSWWFILSLSNYQDTCDKVQIDQDINIVNKSTNYENGGKDFTFSLVPPLDWSTRHDQQVAGIYSSVPNINQLIQYRRQTENIYDQKTSKFLGTIARFDKQGHNHPVLFHMSAGGWDNSQTSSGSRINNLAYLNPAFTNFAIMANNNLGKGWVNFGEENRWTWENLWSLNPNSFNNPDYWLPKLPTKEMSDGLSEVLTNLQQSYIARLDNSIGGSTS